MQYFVLNQKKRENLSPSSWDSQVELLTLSRRKIRGTPMIHPLRGESRVKRHVLGGGDASPPIGAFAQQGAKNIFYCEDRQMHYKGFTGRWCPKKLETGDLSCAKKL